MSVSADERRSQFLLMLRLIREIFCRDGVPHLISAPNNLPKISDYPSYLTQDELPVYVTEPVTLRFIRRVHHRLRYSVTKDENGNEKPT